MAYNFDFDLTRVSRTIFRDIAILSERTKFHSKAGSLAQKLAEKLEIQKITGLPVSDALIVTQDLIDVYVKNLAQGENFRKANGKRVLLLPHCSRKYMDSNCQASFDKTTSSYRCAHCSKDCLVNQATQLGKKKSYDVFVIPGGSCISKILKKKSYQALIAVACPEELMQGMKLVDRCKIATQCVPLLKNGCSDTSFNLRTLGEILEQ